MITAGCQSSKVSYHNSSTRSQLVLTRPSGAGVSGRHLPGTLPTPVRPRDEETDQAGLRRRLRCTHRRNESSPSSFEYAIGIAQQHQPAQTHLLQGQEVTGKEVLAGLGLDEGGGHPGPYRGWSEAHVVLGACLRGARATSSRSSSSCENRRPGHRWERGPGGSTRIE